MVEKPAVFISSTSDLRSARDLVAKVLLSMGYEPVWQDIEPAEGGELLEILRERMAPCALMIQLVGRRYGAEPHGDMRPAAFGRVSFTHYEALYFDETLQRKVIYLFLTPDFPTDPASPEPVELTGLQAAYRARIERANRLHQVDIASELHIEVSLRRMSNEIAKFREAFEARYREVTGKLDRQSDKLDVQSEQLARIEKLLLAQKQANPTAAPTLSDADLALLEMAKKQGDLKTQAAASVLKPDANTDALLAELQAKHEAEEFDLAMLQGKRWYFDKLPKPDKAIEPFERALVLRPDSFAARNYAAVAHTEAHLDDVGAHRRRAIEIYDETLKLIPARSIEWARTQNNLANAWSDLPTGNRAANLAKAIAAYEAALQVFTREDFPAYWGGAHNNLGGAWLKMPFGDRAANLAKAIAAYEAALQVRTREDFPDEWATTQNNLGVAWSDLPTGDRAANLAKAIAAYEAALQTHTRQDFPADWAMTQNNLGVAWSNLPTGDRAANLAKAIAAYEAALQTHTREDFPRAWAGTHYNVGNAWLNMPTGDRAANLAKAIAAYEAALQVYTRHNFPDEWAQTQWNLGVAWDDLPPGDRAANLAKAIAAYEAALHVYTRQDFPANWAQMHCNLAIAFANLARHLSAGRCRRLRQAAANGKSALLVWTHDAFPTEHDNTVKNLGIFRKSYESAGCAAKVPFDDIPPAE